ncbi:MAG: hypothetical protein GF418_03800 [Chitinivibrionales bacterium]|nr:hypothetical protein [Chitinivibrionales bacterium]MBD3394729.1 hypothetical protein [Chitinivibrionales bacterium]
MISLEIPSCRLYNLTNHEFTVHFKEPSMTTQARTIKLCLLFAVLLACGTSEAAVQGAHVLIDSLVGKAQVQRAGHQNWVPCKKGAKLYNNDVLRVMKDSHARLLWTDGSVMYIHPNSQVLMNLYEDTVHNFVTRHATVFFGAVFFVIKEVLPRAISKRYDTKVYTPTAVLSIRGTSFEVRVEKSGGATDVSVLNGTVLVGNIIRKESVFLSAGYKTSVALGQDPVRPEAIVKKEIAVLKTWVPPHVIGAEMKDQIAQAKKDHYTITGKLEDKVLVMPFTNASSYSGGWDIGEVLSSFMAERMGQSLKGMTVMAHGKRADDIMKTGEEKKARFVLTGEIRNFDIVQRATISVSADEYKEYCIARVRIYMQLVDVQGRKLVLAKEVSGEVSGNNVPANTWKSIGKHTFSMRDKKFSNTILAKAIDQAVEQSTGDVSRYLAE